MAGAVYATQKTIAKEGMIAGKGLHSGRPSAVRFRPAPAGTGTQFYHRGFKIENISSDVSESPRCTSIGHGEHEIHTVEHLLAALLGLGISNIHVDVDGDEMPGLDGSAAPFTRFFLELGLVDQKVPAPAYKITEPIFCSGKNKALCIYPDDHLSVAYTLDYDHPQLRDQKVEFTLTPEVFVRDIAPARTFCTLEESEEVKRRGLGLGADHKNTLVISKDGVVGNKLHFPDECARHKVLDLLGDLNLLGFPVLGRVVGLRSGHSLNRQLVQRIKEQRGTMNIKKKDETKKHAMDLEQIKEILPHRFPFLMLDRIVEINDHFVVGIKNVTGNEPFFQGHFPGKPVMPGVLMIEALAQVGGVLMLSKNKGKIAYLVSVNNARFRKPVVPGDQLRLEVEVLKLKSKIGLIHGVGKVDGEEVCDAEIMFTVAD